MKLHYGVSNVHRLNEHQAEILHDLHRLIEDWDNNEKGPYIQETINMLFELQETNGRIWRKLWQMKKEQEAAKQELEEEEPATDDDNNNNNNNN